MPAAVLHRPGGPAAFLEILHELIGRLDCAVPDLDDDPSWILRLPVRPGQDRVAEALTTLADGTFGTRGVREDSQDRSATVIAAGVYTGAGPGERLLSGPDWTRLRWPAGPAIRDERTLDLRAGLLARRRLDESGEFRSLRVAAVTRPGLVSLRAEADGRLSGDPLCCPLRRSPRPWPAGRDRLGTGARRSGRRRRGGGQSSGPGAAAGAATWSAGPRTWPARGRCRRSAARSTG